jgi:hypothetical protein
MLLFCEMIKYILSCDNIDQLLQTLLTNKIRSNIFKTLSSLTLSVLTYYKSIFKILIKTLHRNSESFWMCWRKKTVLIIWCNFEMFSKNKITDVYLLKKSRIICSCVSKLLFHFLGFRTFLNVFWSHEIFLINN